MCILRADTQLQVETVSDGGVSQRHIRQRERSTDTDIDLEVIAGQSTETEEDLERRMASLRQIYQRSKGTDMKYYTHACA